MRFLPHTQEDIQEMLGVVGVDSLDALFTTIPQECCCRLGLNLPEPLTEWELDSHMDDLAGRNASSANYKMYMGAGSYDHYIPTGLGYLRSRSEFLTAYTPYQPEISQGTLQAIYEYQTLASRLMGTEVATASHYDGATALAEALLMSIRVTRKKKVAVSQAIHPLQRRVVETYLKPTGYAIETIPYQADGRTDLKALENMSDYAGVAIQSPNFFGCIEDLEAAGDLAHRQKALFIASFTEAIALGLLKSPGSQGADIVCGEGESFGLSRSYGGPGLGMLGSSKKYMRNLPGRLIGRTKDLDGRDGFVLTLATREQHIRRERATSNICTNNSLCALTAAMYLAFLGGSGLRELAELNHSKAEYLKGSLQESGLALPFASPTFNEFVVRMPAGFDATYKRLLDQKIIAGLNLAPYYPELADCYLMCVTETAAKEDLDTLVKEVTS